MEFSARSWLSLTAIVLAIGGLFVFASDLLAAFGLQQAQCPNEVHDLKFIQNLISENLRLTEALNQSTGGVPSASCWELEKEHKELKELNEKLVAEKEELVNEKLAPLQNASSSSSSSSSSSDGGLLLGLDTDAEKAVAAAKRLMSEAQAKQLAASAYQNGSKLYDCTATEAELKKYLNYKPRGACPDDWYFVQKMIFVEKCFALPRRRCFAAAPPDYVEPTIPFPASVLDNNVLNDKNVLWSAMHYKNYSQLQTRSNGDCITCFNLTKDEDRWNVEGDGSSISLEGVLELKPKGSLKIGLDVGGGTGAFAATMAENGITMVTTAMNIETIGIMLGLPYMQTIAQRGLIPLHLPHQSRTPFFDNTLDIVHAAYTIKYFSLLELEEILFEWDRILRPGGIIWLEKFYAPVDDMPAYMAIIEVINYKKLYWKTAPKEDVAAEIGGKHVYLTAVLEKPRRGK